MDYGIKNDNELLEFLRRCREEITSRDRIIAQLRPQAEAYQVVRQLLGFMPRPSVSEGEDFVYPLSAAIRIVGERVEEEKQPKPTNPAATQAPS